ncbi:hypothetical protein MKW92_002022 [Papaver armeniacum]|nr:hypothetical protein MKW92_002022 [Papaver armeniacum]
MGTIPLVETIQWMIFGINMFIGAKISFKFTSVITMVRMLLLCVYSGFEGIKTFGAWASLWNVSLPKMIAGVTMGSGLFELFPDMLYLASIFVITTGCIAGIYAYDTAIYVLSKDNKRLKPSFLGVFASVVLDVGVMAVISILESYYKPSMSRNLLV